MNRYALFFSIVVLLLATGSATAQSQQPQPGDPKYSWLNGKWENRSKVQLIELRVINGNELVGSSTLQYSDPRPGEVQGPLQGKIIDDETIEFGVAWPRGTTNYVLKRQVDGSLLGPHPTLAGRRLGFTKID